MKKIFWILVLGALASGSMALALGQTAKAKGETVKRDGR
jgi:hypothetical protein